jgi:hypothetical protein
MGLLQIGSRCLLVTRVSGLNRLPVPPANTTSFTARFPPHFASSRIYIVIMPPSRTMHEAIPVCKVQGQKVPHIFFSTVLYEWQNSSFCQFTMASRPAGGSTERCTMPTKPMQIRDSQRWLWHRLKGHRVAGVPEEIALCEFDCRKGQCVENEWESCERLISKAAGELMPGAPTISLPRRT